jgi:isochorismate synthase
MQDKGKRRYSGGLRLAKLINLCLEKNIPFVSFRLPDENAVRTMIQLSGKFNLFETFQEAADRSGFVYAPFHRKTDCPVVLFEPELIIENDNFNDSLLNEISEKEPLYPHATYKKPFETNKEEYLKGVESVIHSFDKTLSKTVLSRIHLENKPDHFDPGKFFVDLQEKYSNVFCHLINIPGAGNWAGATPETFLKMDDERVQTVSLAGTQPIAEGKKDILWKAKEMEEQRLVTNYIIEILKRFDIKDFQIEGPQTISAGNACHLSTKFSFEKSFIQNRVGEFIDCFHPTPAVCGLPKEKALEMILKTEKHNREYYAGFCGTLNMDGKTDLFVNLRCMKILKDKLVLFVGGGLTAKSHSEKEWEETVLKAQTLLSLIQMH